MPIGFRKSGRTPNKKIEKRSGPGAAAIAMILITLLSTGAVSSLEGAALLKSGYKQETKEG